jgi:hypothetical protein
MAAASNQPSLLLHDETKKNKKTRPDSTRLHEEFISRRLAFGA